MYAMPIFISLLGAPGSRKSTVALGVTYELKKKGISCEYLPEYAKQLTWAQDKDSLDFQPLVTATQAKRQVELCKEGNGLDYVITDTSLLLGILYSEFGSNQSFTHWIQCLDNQFNNIRYFIELDTTTYSTSGRGQTELEAVDLEHKLKKFLNESFVQYIKLKGSTDTMVKSIVSDIIKMENFGK